MRSTADFRITDHRQFLFLGVTYGVIGAMVCSLHILQYWPMCGLVHCAVASGAKAVAVSLMLSL